MCDISSLRLRSALRVSPPSHLSIENGVDANIVALVATA